MGDAIIYVIGIIGRMLFELLIIGTARVVLPLLTFGKWHVAPFRKMDFLISWPMYKRSPNGGLIFNSLPAFLIGMVIWMFGVGLLFAAIA